MRTVGSTGVRLGTWWVERYTSTAPHPAGADRRAEVRADLHDQQAHARVHGLSERQVSLDVMSRVLRGMAADVAWRVRSEREPGRLEWHLSHPSSVLGALFVVLVPAAMSLDTVRARPDGVVPVEVVLSSMVALLSASAMGFAAVAGARRVRAGAFSVRGTSLVAVRRAAVCWMCATWATAAVWRFAPNALSEVSAVAWLGFGVSATGYLGALGLGAVRRARTGLGLALGKVSS